MDESSSRDVSVVHDAPAHSEAIRITGLSSGGDGVGRTSEGRVVFVDGGVPGELVELADLRFQKKVLRARVGRILEPSADRVEPRCVHFGECGGCRWQHLRYPAQLEAKRRILADALERIGRFDIEDEIEIVPSPDAYGYRARARWVESEGQLGYRVRGSRSISPVEVCPVLLPAAEAALAERVATARDAASEQAAIAPKTSGKRRRGRSESERVVTVGSSGRAIVHTVRSSRPRRGKPESVSIEVCGELLRVSAESFVQGNALLWETLAVAVRDQCLAERAGRRPERFVELYSGVGFFTLPLARSGASGVALESDRSALADLAFNLRRAGLAEQVDVLSGRVESRGDLEKRLADADVLLVDPPRIGLDDRVREAIASAGPERCVYVSCDPATLARDLRVLCDAGYSIASLEAFDLFPQTPHVESITRLERPSPSSHPKT